MRSDQIISDIDRYLRIATQVGALGTIGPVYGEGPLAPNYFFVDGTNGSDSNDGHDPRAPLATIQAAVDKTVASRGDVISIVPGTYAENVVITGKHNLTLQAAFVKANSKRVGIAPASGVPLTLAQNNRVSLIGIRCAGTGAVGCLCDSESSYFENCDFTADTTAGFRFFANTDSDFTGSGSVFQDCVFRECTGIGLLSSKGGPTAVDPAYGLQATNVNVRRCQFYGNSGADIADGNESETPTYFNQWEISECRFITADKTTYLDMDGGSVTDCLICGNFFADVALEFINAVKISAGVRFAGNYDENGLLDAQP